ncbi:hypothetical protein [Flavobacterium beibuense]|uniref:Lipoprotein n=1 Tax=Flavobacterium beibuense TaxID=657326 RepID=A0A444W5T6_9FLAO|nr:hypothetical protein [Flavobacterium beibuense]RYJ41230.1 hypothetical protein NU09_3264 [Flavobacterium beibuense]
MKRIYLPLLGTALLLLTSCGPKRLGCGKRWCEATKSTEQVNIKKDA